LQGLHGLQGLQPPALHGLQGLHALQDAALQGLQGEQAANAGPAATALVMAMAVPSTRAVFLKLFFWESISHLSSWINVSTLVRGGFVYQYN
jgi:hypothetical protein